MSIAGKARQDVDVAGFSRCEFPTIFYRNIRGVRWIREKYRKYVERRTRRGFRCQPGQRICVPLHDHHLQCETGMAAVHRRGVSCRPQIIERESNALYYDILNTFERKSGLPVLVNTSFNVHEEPIVNKPSECIRALLDGRIDFVVTTQGIYERASPVAS